jgi:carboxyl-terminal processing protease
MLETLEFGRNYYQTPEEYETAQEYLNRRDYTGIGAWVSTDKDYLTIISPIKGSPAEKAGLRPNDQIIAIDGEDMTGVEPEAARQKVLGPAGTNVTLTILRAGQEPFDVTITRAQIVVPLVESEMLEGDIAYVSLSTFGDTASQDLRAALTELLAQNPKGLILDLRNNGGGYLDQAVSVVSEFIPGKQVVVIEKDGDGSEDTSASSGRGLATDIPLVVLVNEGSASASEIVAGAIQDYGRAKLVGATTFGKGSVQILTPLGDNEGMIGITVAAWLTPNGRTIEGTGLTPDIVVERTDADFDAGRDPQLEKAIELLKR